MNSLKIATRLKLLGMLIISTVILLAGLGYSMLSNMATAADSMYHRGLVGSKFLSDSNNAVWELRFGIANYILASPDGRKKILEGRPAFYGVLDESLNKYAAGGRSADQDAVLKELVEAFQAYKVGAPKWFELIDADKMAEAAEYRAKVTNVAGSAMVKNIKLLLEKQLTINEELEKQSKATAERGRILLAAIGLSAFLIVGLAVLIIANAISKSLHAFQSQIESIEQNSDFTRRVTVRGNDEVAQTTASFNKLLGTFQASLHELISSVEDVSQAANTLSSSSGRVAAASGHQSEATSSMAATVEEVTVSINAVSENAKNAMDLSTSSSELSNRGQEVIQRTVSEVREIAQTMRATSGIIEKLGEQSTQISSVVQVIKEVADQTNLLALNAAIEAARAGEQGRGFAVVADEVRKLAERTTQSTQEITAMIGAIQMSSQEAVASMSAAVRQMDGGVDLAQQAGVSINEIRDRSNSVTAVVKEIASALQEQSTASNDLAQHVENVARMTEANNAATGEIAKATHDLMSLSDAMRDVGRKFRT